MSVDPTLLPALEPISEQRTRRFVLLAFLAFYLACVPLWYETSRVQRVALPTLPVEPMPTRVHSVQVALVAESSDAADLARWTRWMRAARQSVLPTLLQTTNGTGPGTSQRWHVASSEVEVTAAPSLFTATTPADLAAAGDKIVAAHQSDATMSIVLLVARPSERWSSSSGGWKKGAPIVGSARSIFFVVEASDDEATWNAHLASGATLLHSLLASQTCTPADGDAATSSASACATSRSLSQRLSFTLVNGESESAAQAEPSPAWTWDFHAIQVAYLDGFLTSLAPYVTFSVDSSVMHFAHLTDARPEKRTIDADTHRRIMHPPQPAATANTNTDQATRATTPTPSTSNLLSSHFLPLHSLQHMMGAIGQWNNPSPLVASSLEFFAFVPHQQVRPLWIDFEEATRHQQGKQAQSQHQQQQQQPSTAMYVERFGGIVILNSPGDCPSNGTASVACQLDLDGAAKQAMQVFVHQIRQTLALAPSHHLTTAACPSGDACTFLPNRQTAIAEWELDLLGARLIEVNIAETMRVLRSLYDLLEEVPHMPVNEEIQALVAESLRQRQLCLTHLRQGEFASAGFASQSAALGAHRAFFHHDMLPALYFPDEHLYAVYLPLFLPISVPLLAALWKLLTSAQEKERRRKKDKLRKKVADPSTSS